MAEKACGEMDEATKKQCDDFHRFAVHNEVVKTWLGVSLIFLTFTFSYYLWRIMP